MSSHHVNILRELYAAQLGEIFEWAIENQLKYHRGWLPLWHFRGAIGGDSANVRLNELKRPEGDGGVGKGIPIRKEVFKFELNGQTHRSVCYVLDMTPDQAKAFIDLDNCRLRKDVVAAWGFEIYDEIDDTGGKKGAVARLRKKPIPNQQPLFASLGI